uniref:Transposase n=1 Tax=Caenorhabditis tropicalis TaxID=1561998 RepID=A0A1I7UJ94_9PELO
MCHFETSCSETGHIETATLRNQSLRNHDTPKAVHVFNQTPIFWLENLFRKIETRTGFEVTGFRSVAVSKCR